MDELKEKENILLKNKSHILRMPDNKKKIEMLEAYFSLLQYHSFLLNLNGKDDLYIDDDFVEKYEHYIFTETSKKIDELEKNSLLLLRKYQNIIDTYNENNFCKYQFISPIKTDSKTMYQAISNFFKTLGDDVLKIFLNMVNNNNIFLNNGVMERMGYAMDSTPIDNACIVIQNIPNYLDFYITLAHEIGHCYQFYLQKNQRVYATFDPYCEITSILFEKLFIEYLKNSYLLKDYRVLNLENHISFLTSVSISKELCKVLMEDKRCIINPYDLTFKSKLEEESIQNEILNDCGYVKPFEINTSFVEFHYSFGNIIANYFLEKMRENFEAGWKEFKNFICTINYLPMEEVINDYFDVNIIKKSIKKLTKSYRNG